MHKSKISVPANLQSEEDALDTIDVKQGHSQMFSIHISHNKVSIVKSEFRSHFELFLRRLFLSLNSRFNLGSIVFFVFFFTYP